MAADALSRFCETCRKPLVRKKWERSVAEFLKRKFCDVACVRMGYPVPEEFHAEPPAGSFRARMTPRQRWLASLLIDGLSNREMAKAMNVSERTIKNYLKPLFDLTGFDSRVQVACAILRDEQLHPGDREGITT